jgi:hypothetical protein
MLNQSFFPLPTGERAGGDGLHLYLTPFNTWLNTIQEPLIPNPSPLEGEGDQTVHPNPFTPHKRWEPNVPSPYKRPSSLYFSCANPLFPL